MSHFFGGGSVGNQAPPVHHIRVSDAQWGIPIPVVYGRSRLPAHHIWLGNLFAVENSGPGKGFAGSSGSGVFYTYTIALIRALCHGPIKGFGRAFAANAGGLIRRSAAYVAAHLVEFKGELGQAPWSFLTSHHPGMDLGYSGIAYLAKSDDDLGTSPVLQQTTFEVFGMLPYSDAIPDADASAVIQDMIANPVFGMVPNAPWLDSGVTFADLTNYIVANGYFISPLFDQQKPGREWLQLIFELIYADAVWSEGQLRAVPYSTDPTQGNGVTWRPNLTAVCNFSDDDFRVTSPTDNELVVTVQDPLSRYNVVRIEFLNVLNDYTIEPYEAMDESDMITLNRRPMPTKQYHPIPTASMAGAIARDYLQKNLAINRTYQFQVAPTKIALCDPMDVVSLTSEFYGLNNSLVRIVSTEEQGDPDDSQRGRSDLEVVVTCEDLAPSAQLAFLQGGGGGGGGGGNSGLMTVISVADGDFGSTIPAFWVSVDGGKTFDVKPTPSGLVPQDSFIAGFFNPANPQQVIIGEDSLVSTNDGGGSFVTRIAGGVHQVPYFFGDSQNPSNLFTGTGRAIVVGSKLDNPYPDLGHWHGWVGYSDDLFATQTDVILDAQRELSSVAMSPGGTLVTVSYGSNVAPTSTAVIYRSINNGISWTPGLSISAPVATPPSFDYVLHNGNYFIVLGQDGSTAKVWKSTDDGLTWSSHILPLVPANFVYQPQIAWDPTTSKWYLSKWFGNKVYSSTDGQDFSTVEIDNSSGPHTSDAYFGVLVINNKVYIQGTTSTGFVFYRLDPGPVWTRIDLASSHSGNGSGLVGNAQRLCFGTGDGFWYYSDDGGNTWTLSASSMAPGSFASVIVGLPGTGFPATLGGVGNPQQPSGGFPAPDPSNQPLNVNPPIFVLPGALASKPNTIWIGLSGQGGYPTWGGANILMSDDGGSNYNQIGQTTNSATMGVLNAPLPARGAAPGDLDITDTLYVDLSESAGVVSSIATSQADKGYNLAVIDNEYIAFANVGVGLDPSNPNQFGLTYLRRGLYGSTIASHAIGAPFLFLGSITFLNQGVAVVSYPAADAGDTLMFKFPSFNINGGAPEDPSTLPAYSLAVP